MSLSLSIYRPRIYSTTLRVVRLQKFHDLHSAVTRLPLQLQRGLRQLQSGSIQEPVRIGKLRICCSLKPRRFKPSELILCGSAGRARHHQIRRHIARYRSVIGQKGVRSTLQNWCTPE